MTLNFIKPGSSPLVVGKDCPTVSSDQLAQIRKAKTDLRMVPLRLPIIARKRPDSETLEVFAGHLSYCLMHDIPDLNVPMLVLTEELPQAEIDTLRRLDHMITDTISRLFSTNDGPSRPILARENRIHNGQGCPLCSTQDTHAVLRVPKDWKAVLKRNAGGEVSCKKCQVRILLHQDEFQEFISGKLRTEEFIRTIHGPDGNKLTCAGCTKEGRELGVLLERRVNGKVVARACCNNLKVPALCNYQEVLFEGIWMFVI